MPNLELSAPSVEEYVETAMTAHIGKARPKMSSLRTRIQRSRYARPADSIGKGPLAKVLALLRRRAAVDLPRHAARTVWPSALAPVARAPNGAVEGFLWSAQGRPSRPAQTKSTPLAQFSAPKARSACLQACDYGPGGRPGHREHLGGGGGGPRRQRFWPPIRRPCRLPARRAVRRRPPEWPARLC